MRRFHLSPLAESDLTEIWRYSAETWGEAQADRYVSDLFDRFAWVADHPEMGRKRPEILPGASSMQVGRHVIFYETVAGRVVILRIVHERRNMAALRFVGEGE
ncbi:type II toxin-antitoxin system RelE/ParE family toxin [Roseovarius sp.]|uniref:type II toxin-antitoxin system RelE/ParE family toxin n=1 Tax=Roseovarius sp. TaxID=1486281 RepID=UPI003BAD9A48